MMSFSDMLKEFWKGLSKFNALPKNLSTIFSNSTYILAILGCIVILCILIASKKVKFDAKLITRIALVLALATILQAFKIYKLPQGGSVTLGSMIPILLIGFLYGPIVGLLTGFLFGVINLITDPSIVHPVQLLFDYPLAFMALGITGFFKDFSPFGKYTKIIAVFLALLGRFLCHTISGAVFFGEYATPGMNVWIYSIIYNGSYMGVETIISLAVFYFLPIERILKSVKLSAVNTL